MDFYNFNHLFGPISASEVGSEAGSLDRSVGIMPGQISKARDCEGNRARLEKAPKGKVL